MYCMSACLAKTILVVVVSPALHIAVVDAKLVPSVDDVAVTDTMLERVRTPKIGGEVESAVPSAVAVVAGVIQSLTTVPMTRNFTLPTHPPAGQVHVMVTVS